MRGHVIGYERPRERVRGATWGRYGYPALIALNPTEGKYATLKSGFTVTGIRDFVESIRSVKPPILTRVHSLLSPF